MARGGCTLGAKRGDDHLDVERDSPAFEVLAWCVDDFTSLATVFNLASKGQEELGAQRTAALDAIRLLIRAGLVRVGEMSTDVPGLAYWQVDSDTSYERLRSVLMGLVAPPSPVLNIWLHATEAGRHYFEVRRQS